MSKILGALRVVLGADTSQFDKGLKDAQKNVSGFGSKIKAGLAVGAAAAAGFAMATMAALRGPQEEIDKLAKMSRSIGMPVEELSRLKHAAELSGTSVEGVATGVKKLSKELSDMATNSTGPAARAFRAMGISVRDASGQMKSVNDLMGEVADKFSQYEDGAEKTALAMALFGKSGADLIPMLNGGKAALEGMKREADELGLTIDGKTAAATEQFNDNLMRLGRVKDSFILRINQALIPTLSALSDRLVAVAKDGASMKSFADDVAGAFRQSITVMERAIATYMVARSVVTNFWESLKHPMEDWVRFQERIVDDYFNIIQNYRRRLAEQGGLDMAKSLGIDAIDKYAETVKGKAAPALAASVDKVKDFSRALTEKIERMQMERQLIGATVREQAFYTEKLAFENMLRKENITLSATRRAQMLAEIEGLARQAEATELAKERWREFQQVTETFQSSFSSSVDRALDGTFKLKTAVSDLLKSFAKMIANQAFMQLFGGGSQTGAFDITRALASSFGGFRAGGGDVRPGRGYIVGESGPEWFEPDVGGQIVPNDQLGAPGGLSISMPVTINAPGADAAGLARVANELRQFKQAFPGMVVATFNDANARRMIRSR